MKHTRTTLLILSAVSLAAILLSACGPAATPTPAPTQVPTEVPTQVPTEVPPTPTSEPVTLTVNGLVNNELQLTDSALHGMTVVTLTLDHPKNGPTEYTGVRLNDLLTEAGIQSGAATVSFVAGDGFTNDLDLATVQACTDCMVAFDPATPGVYNLAMPGQTSGKAWVNGLVTITLK